MGLAEEAYLTSEIQLSEDVSHILPFSKGRRLSSKLLLNSLPIVCQLSS